ncbi:hypothetical protein NSQ62_08015 [Solibacillus sp. FSL H8-0523]|uniref:hypothetical protein n=1 Tax=Solibacillus sp. FSL H8-0523 TaxID=2954511 RepID=UPI003100F38C
MKRSQAVRIVEEYLSRSGGGALIIDTADNTLDWTMDSNAINHSSYVVVESYDSNSKCECGEYYSQNCEPCGDYANYLLDRVENGFVDGGIVISD